MRTLNMTTINLEQVSTKISFTSAQILIKIIIISVKHLKCFVTTLTQPGPLPASSTINLTYILSEIMRTSKIIYCFGIVKGNKFNKEEFTYPINGIMQTKSEIMENPYICVLDGDYKDPSCRQIDYSDYNVLYKAIMEQSRMLEGLFIGTHSSV